MSDGAIALRVLTQEGLALSDEAVSIIAPGSVGYVGFLRNHAPLVSTVHPGKLRWKQPGGQWQTRYIGDGLLEIAKNQLVILTTTVSETPPLPVRRAEAVA